MGSKDNNYMQTGSKSYRIRKCGQVSTTNIVFEKTIRSTVKTKIRKTVSNDTIKLQVWF